MRRVIVSLHLDGEELARVAEDVNQPRGAELITHRLHANFDEVIERTMEQMVERGDTRRRGQMLGDFVMRVSVEEDEADPFPPQPIWVAFDSPPPAAGPNWIWRTPTPFDPPMSVSDGRMYGSPFDYFGSDPNQIGHGRDGGVPMTLEELIGADEKMDAIDRVLDSGL